jgi:hypothetical protein
MKKNKTIDELTFHHIKNLGVDEPSADFTQKVMQSVSKEYQTIHTEKKRNYVWLISLIPVSIILGWFFLVMFDGTAYINRLWITATSSLHSIFSLFSPVFNQLKNLSVQPMIVISFIAMLSLLIIEEFISRAKKTL